MLEDAARGPALDFGSDLKQRIIGFHQDEEGDWVAELACGHRLHTRHDPPWLVRTWVLTTEGRQGRIGTELNCTDCDAEELALWTGTGN
jgi:hypothetical protein